MKAPKYLDLVMEALKSLNADVRGLSDKLSDMNADLSSVKTELSHNNKLMEKYNEQLEIHIKGVELAHMRADVHDKRILDTEEEIKTVQNKLTERLTSVYNYVEEQKQEKNFLKKLEDEDLRKKEKLYKSLRIVSTLIGIPLAAYGLLKFLIQMFQ